MEVVALRGVPGTPGDAGALAGGQWLYLGQHGSGGSGSGSVKGAGLQPPPPPLPPLPPPPPASGPPWPLHVLLSNGRTAGVDAVLSATGVAPATGALPRSYARAWDGGLVVNPSMQTSASARVYAAGDCAAVAWPQALHCAGGSGGGAPLPPSPPLWFQLRTWAQARAAGAHAARCMAGAREAVEGGGGGMAFEVFAHTTGVCGLKLVLLGLFNGQGLGAAWEAAVRGSLRGAEGAGGGSAAPAPAPAPAPSLDCSSPWGRVALLLRVTPGEEFVQVVVVGGRVVGALLLGDTGLEETLENLICNGTDVRVAGGEEILDLLNPEVDIEDYFD